VGVIGTGTDHLSVEDLDEKMLMRSRSWIIRWGGGLVLLLLVVWPLLSVAVGDFSLKYFTFWIIISFVWSLIAAFVIITLPLYESIGGITSILRGIIENVALAGGHSSSLGSSHEIRASDSVQLIVQNPINGSSSLEES
jgi:hypothetical protein